MLKFLGVSTLVVLPFFPASAATIALYSAVDLESTNTDTGNADIDDQTTLVVDTLTGTGIANVTGAAALPGELGSNSASVDITQGKLKVGGVSSAGLSTNSEAFGPIGLGVYNTAVAQLELGMTASGSGTVRFDLAVDGFWNFIGQDFIVIDGGGNVTSGVSLPVWNISGLLQLGPVNDSFDLSWGRDPQTGSLDRVLQVFASVNDGDFLKLNALLGFGFYSVSTGSLDFLNTATLSYSTSPGLNFTFDDKRFLTNENVAPVPVPAAFWLLASVIAWLASLSQLAGKRRVSTRPALTPYP